MIFDNSKKIIKSDESAIIEDLDKNKIFLDKFEYSTQKSLF